METNQYFPKRKGLPFPNIEFSCLGIDKGLYYSVISYTKARVVKELPQSQSQRTGSLCFSNELTNETHIFSDISYTFASLKMILQICFVHWAMIFYDTFSNFCLICFFPWGNQVWNKILWHNVFPNSAMLKYIVLKHCLIYHVYRQYHGGDIQWWP